jgi:hypothetical protein
MKPPASGRGSEGQKKQKHLMAFEPLTSSMRSSLHFPQQSRRCRQQLPCRDHPGPPGERLNTAPPSRCTSRQALALLLLLPPLLLLLVAPECSVLEPDAAGAAAAAAVGVPVQLKGVVSPDTLGDASILKVPGDPAYTGPLTGFARSAAAAAAGTCTCTSAGTPSALSASAGRWAAKEDGSGSSSCCAPMRCR